MLNSALDIAYRIGYNPLIPFAQTESMQLNLQLHNCCCCVFRNDAQEREWSMFHQHLTLTQNPATIDLKLAEERNLKENETLKLRKASERKRELTPPESILSTILAITLHYYYQTNIFIINTLYYIITVMILYSLFWTYSVISVH